MLVFGIGPGIIAGIVFKDISVGFVVDMVALVISSAIGLEMEKKHTSRELEKSSTKDKKDYWKHYWEERVRSDSFSNLRVCYSHKWYPSGIFSIF
jgi:hypothetical protein